MEGISFFEFDPPEHLPSSPMCPANPMHSLRGKGVCVVSFLVKTLSSEGLKLIMLIFQFHGRSKQASMDDAAAIAEEEEEEEEEAT